MSDLKTIQERMPWGLHDYCDKFKANPLPHRDFSHAHLHVYKAMGKITSMIDAADHTGLTIAFDYEKLRNYLADIVICTIRMAKVFPAGPIDLQSAVIDRIEEKMGVRVDGSIKKEDGK